MKFDIILFACYAGLLLLLDPSAAAQYLVVSTLLAMGVRRLVGAKHFYQSFGWLRAHPLQTIALFGLVLVFVLLPFVLGPLLFNSAAAPFSDLPRVLLGSPVTLLWFWAFLAAGVRFQEHRINRRVEKRLAEIRGAGNGQGARDDR